MATGCPALFRRPCLRFHSRSDPSIRTHSSVCCQPGLSQCTAGVQYRWQQLEVVPLGTVPHGQVGLLQPQQPQHHTPQDQGECELSVRVHGAGRQPHTGLLAKHARLQFEAAVPGQQPFDVRPSICLLRMHNLFSLALWASTASHQDQPPCPLLCTLRHSQAWHCTVRYVCCSRLASSAARMPICQQHPQPMGFSLCSPQCTELAQAGGVQGPTPQCNGHSSPRVFHAVEHLHAARHAKQQGRAASRIPHLQQVRNAQSALHQPVLASQCWVAWKP